MSRVRPFRASLHGLQLQAGLLTTISVFFLVTLLFEQTALAHSTPVARHSQTYPIQLANPADPWRSGELGELVAESEVLDQPGGFDQAIVSWNLKLPFVGGERQSSASPAMGIELRVYDRRDGAWSPWVVVGEWTGPAASPEQTLLDPAYPQGRVLGFVDSAGRLSGRVDVDMLEAKSGAFFTAAQVRVIARNISARDSPATASQSCEIAALWICVTDTRLLSTGASTTAQPAKDSFQTPASGAGVDIALAVPHISQKTSRGELSGRLCSPTSLSMVLRFSGLDIDVLDVALRGYDPLHDLFGSWPRATQAAFSLGVPAHVTRFNSWDEVDAVLSAGQPIIASITVRPGELRNAPYDATPGHLIVLTGTEGPDMIRVNDPAAGDPGKGVVKYSRDDLTTVWLRRKLGTAYVLSLPGRSVDQPTK